MGHHTRALDPRGNVKKGYGKVIKAGGELSTKLRNKVQ